MSRWEPDGCWNGDAYRSSILLRCAECGATEEREVVVEYGRAWQVGPREGETDCEECGAADGLRQDY